MREKQWEPLDDLLRFRNTVNRMIDDHVGSPGHFDRFAIGRPFPIDIFESPDTYLIEASLPGVTPTDIWLTATKTTVTIRAQPQPLHAQDAIGTYLRQERSGGIFARIIPLPDVIDPEQVTSTYAYGVLTLRLPKAEASQAKQIFVQVTEVHAGTH